jgi:hypothetical protein
MNKLYMKLFCRLLNTSVLNGMIIYRDNTGKSIDQLSFRIQLVEGLFVKYASAGSTLISQHSAPSNRTTFYKQDSSNSKEI